MRRAPATPASTGGSNRVASLVAKDAARSTTWAAGRRLAPSSDRSGARGVVPRGSRPLDPREPWNPEHLAGQPACCGSVRRRRGRSAEGRRADLASELVPSIAARRRAPRRSGAHGAADSRRQRVGPGVHFTRRRRDSGTAPLRPVRSRARGQTARNENPRRQMRNPPRNADGALLTSRLWVVPCYAQRHRPPAPR